MVWQLVVAILVVAGKLSDDFWLLRPIQQVVDDQNAIADNLVKSWGTEPFTDVVVVDIGANNLLDTECPVTHPDDVVYSIWPGTRHMCDCLERDGDREYYLDIICSKGTYQG